jgi:hypothetical protein
MQGFDVQVKAQSRILLAGVIICQRDEMNDRFNAFFRDPLHKSWVKDVSLYKPVRVDMLLELWGRSLLIQD